MHKMEPNHPKTAATAPIPIPPAITVGVSPKQFKPRGVRFLGGSNHQSCQGNGSAIKMRVCGILFLVVFINLFVVGALSCGRYLYFVSSALKVCVFVLLL